METRSDELESFKTQINLSEYAASEGYQLDRQQSSRNSAIMRHDNGDKIVIAKGKDGHWVYFSVRDDTDHGSIIDFIDRRAGLNLGHIRKRLRPWLGRDPNPPKRPPAGSYARNIAPGGHDRTSLLVAFAACQAVEQHPYLEQRGIPVDIQASKRFAGRVFRDARRNAVFPHYDQNGLCGFEIKNRNFTGFAPGGQKGLWYSGTTPADNRLVIAESATDALSYHVLHPDERARYFSIGGEMNPHQPALLQSAFDKLVQAEDRGGDPEVVIATDADPSGRKLADQIAALAAQIPGLTVTRAEPPTEGADWNDVLQTSTCHDAAPPIRT